MFSQSVQPLSHVRLFATPWTAAYQASLSITNSRSLLKLLPIESATPSNHLIFCHPLLLLPSILPSIRVFSSESVLHIKWPKYWSFSFSISPSNEYSGLIFFLFFFPPVLHFFIYFLKYKFIYFNWRLITLQYYIGFAIHQHESTTVYMCSQPWTPLPQSPKDCSRHLCLFCCLAYRVIVTIFLNSIYVLVYCIGVFLSGLLHSV